MRVAKARDYQTSLDAKSVLLRLRGLVSAVLSEYGVMLAQCQKAQVNMITLEMYKARMEHLASFATLSDIELLMKSRLFTLTDKELEDASYVQKVRKGRRKSKDDFQGEG